jgi:hypothetical protein
LGLLLQRYECVVAHAAVAQPINCGIARSPRKPGDGSFRAAVRLPVLHGSDKRILDRIFSKLDIRAVASQRRHQLRMGAAIQLLYRSANSLSRHGNR